MAGLAAAVELHERGRRVLVLEARDRIGGRVHTIRGSGDSLPVELGAEFVHGDAPRIEALAREAGVALLEVPGSHWRKRRGRIDEVGAFEESLGSTFRRAGRVVRTRGERSFAQALRDARVRDPARAQALAYVEGFQAADAERISARSLAGPELGIERIRRVLPGFAALARHLRARLPRDAVIGNTIATLVRWDRSGVEVECRTPPGTGTRRFRSRRALVAAPLGVLRPSQGLPALLTFDPALHEKDQAASKLAMGHVVRIVLAFRRAFWEEEADALGFLHAPELPVPTFWTPRPVHAPRITAWTGGPKAVRLAELGEEERTARALESLALALGVPARTPRKEFLAARSFDWSSDPFSRGAYSHPLVGGASAARALGRSVRGILIFAGEATCLPPANGTVEGALSSGARVAREILEAR